MANNEVIKSIPGNKKLPGGRPEKFGPGDLPEAGGEKNKVGAVPKTKAKSDGVTESVATPKENSLMAVAMPNQKTSMVNKSVLSVDENVVGGIGRPNSK